MKFAAAASVLLLAHATVPAADKIARNGMVAIPGGPFTMGSDSGPDDERPAHALNIASFEIDRLPVTNREFADFLNAAGTHNQADERLFDDDDPDARIHKRGERWVADPGYERHPVVEVSWAGARDYCVSRAKRLPTEAEWEKAARGTDGRIFPRVNTPPDRTRARFAARFNETAPVDAHPAGASPYGVLDMAGNAWEWVASAYRPYPYNANDGREDSKAGPVRGTRGGSHDSPAQEMALSH